MTNDKDIQQLIDRQAILDCLTRYCRGVDRLDRELLLSAYHPDAIDDHGALVGSPEDMVEWGRLRDPTGPLSTQHHLTNHTCEIDGDTAHAETYYLYTARNRDETVWSAAGRYIDRFERRDGAWKIAMRYCIVEWSVTTKEGPIPFADIPDVNANGVPGRNRADPSYLRPLVNRREKRFPVV
jgi:hypothetical protein